ncbi:NADPH2:quinone reductase [Paraburkholderia youngii]|uniref:NAD(P)H-quinone oxidoreductase n=1 Tax=Paraburkholderia youngii TaxID=2782701 RepID=UPI003D1E2063
MSADDRNGDSAERNTSFDTAECLPYLFSQTSDRSGLAVQTIHISRAGGPEVLQGIICPQPQPGPGELLLRVSYAGVNRHDCNQRASARHPNITLPANIPGLEVAGEVMACGPGIENFRPGDSVCALVDGGGYAEMCLADAALTLPWPTDELRTGAALPEGLFTAWYNLIELARLRPGERLLIHGGTSGVGLIATQLAVMGGAEVWSTCGNEEKRALSASFGAARTFNYRAPDFLPALQEAVGNGMDVILDLSGLCYFNSNPKLAADGGRIIYLSSSSGEPVPLNGAALMTRQVWITASRLRQLPREHKARLAAALTGAHWLDLSAIRLHIDSEYPLAEAARAHERMESGGHAGKILLAVSEPVQFHQ